MENSNGWQWAVIFFFAWLISIMLMQVGMKTWDWNVTNGKVFKLGDATYKCEQVNKLEYE